eukprot:1822038-Prymnesium_polylepis.2
MSASIAVHRQLADDACRRAPGICDIMVGTLAWDAVAGTVCIAVGRSFVFGKWPIVSCTMKVIARQHVGV